MAALERQVGGDHYKRLGIQPVEFVMSNQMGFCEGNIVKYVTRWREKGGIQDLRKARHFLDFIMENQAYRDQVAVNRRQYVICAQMGAHSADDYIARNVMINPAAGVVRHIWHWNISGRPAELHSARNWLEELIQLALEEEAA